MNILLFQMDGTMPNLVLMKLSAYHKEQGDHVVLQNHLFNTPIVPDKVYISCVFARNAGDALGIAKMFDCPVQLGGSGIDLDSELPEDVEHIMPDYGLYAIGYSMGFVSRGCIRNCPWCIVPKKEGGIHFHAPISEFWDPQHNKLVLLDNNLLACKRWKEALEFIITNKLKVNFNQGLDIRLVDDEKANWLSKIDAYTHTFKTRMFHFAFDDRRYEKALRKGVETLNAHGVPSHKITIYFLCHFDSTFKDEMERFAIIRELGCHPYCMLYNDRKDDPRRRHFERWVNRHLYKVCDFKDYKP